MHEGLKQEMRGLKDPGNVLIFVYILSILALLLFAGLQSAKADAGRAQKGVYSVHHQAPEIQVASFQYRLHSR